MTFFFCIYVVFNSVSQASTVVKSQFPPDTQSGRWPTGISGINFHLTSLVGFGSIGPLWKEVRGCLHLHWPLQAKAEPAAKLGMPL